MNLSILRLAPLIIVFMWAQLCCCHGWALAGAAHRTVAQTADQCDSVLVNGCCSSTDESPAPLPCDDHDGCVACQPWMNPGGQSTEGMEHDGGTAMEIGAPRDAARWPQADIVPRRSAAIPRPPSTLLRLRCALVI